MRVKQAIAVDDRCMLLIQDTKEIVTWGGNQRGQLGLGHYEDISEPTVIESLSKSGTKISYMASGGDLNLACSETGDAYAWPFTQNMLK
jgi:alpha-tubulin suppressor-like RCC1 family protein